MCCSFNITFYIFPGSLDAHFLCFIICFAFISGHNLFLNFRFLWIPYFSCRLLFSVFWTLFGVSLLPEKCGCISLDYYSSIWSIYNISGNVTYLPYVYLLPFGTSKRVLVILKLFCLQNLINRVPLLFLIPSQCCKNITL